MRGLLALFTASLIGLAAAKAGDHSVDLKQPAQAVNATHFKDPKSGKTYVHFDCDVTHGKASSHFNNTVHDLHRRHEAGAIGARSARYVSFRGNTQITVKTYFHVLTKASSAGSITQAMVNSQLQALNQVYNQYGITFTMGGTDFNANDAWAVASGDDMDALKKALRKGTYADLNLYFHTDLDGGILGTCTLPSSVPKGADPSIYNSDGCNIQAGTMPGGSIYGYTQGMTAVHETGHWLGLLHTFEGYSCSGDGDFISDTRVESTSTDGCPDSPAKNSCPGVDGVDPIHNVMDYSTDACYTGFTPLQIQRIGSLWQQYRVGN